MALAGLLPQLRRGAIAGSADWILLDSLLPGAHPLETLGITIANALPYSSLTTIRADLEASERGLHLLAARLVSQTEPPYAVAFSPDGTLLASSSGDATIRLWDVASGQPLGTPLTGLIGNVTNVAFTPDGRHLIATNPGGIILMWNVDLPGWPSAACRIANRNLTRQEWRHYLPGLPYQKTCPGLPAGS